MYQAPSQDELMLLTKFLEVSLKHLNPHDNRQNVLCIVFRFLRYVLPHPNCSSLVEKICDAVRLVFIKYYTDRSRENLVSSRCAAHTRFTIPA